MSQLAVKIQEQFARTGGFSTFCRSLSPKVIDEACAAEGIAVGRKRRLPPASVVWMLVGMAMFRDEAIQAIAKRLNTGGQFMPQSSSISEARSRLGSGVLRWLFQKLGLFWNDELEKERVRGLLVLGIDGTVVTLEDTKKNVAYFGKPGSRKDKSVTARPQARAVGLMDLTTKTLLDGEVVPLAKGEHTAVQPLLDRLPESSLTIVDRGFQSKATFAKITHNGRNRHFVARVKSTFKPRYVQAASRCSWIGEIAFTETEREQDPSLPKSMQIRIVEYTVEGHKDVIRLATSLLNESDFPATEVARLYHRRWEFELGLRDLKVTLLKSKNALRSKTPDGVLQEIYAIFLTYNLVRHEVGLVANYYGVSPQRFSFKTALSAVDRFFTIFSSDYADFNTVSDALEDMRMWIWHERLRKRDPERVCPRWVKDKQPSKFPKKPSSPSGV